MNRCKTCRFWERTDETFNRPFMGICLSEKWVYGNGELSPDCVNYGDSEDYAAWFRTGEDFGCTHWEEN